MTRDYDPNEYSRRMAALRQRLADALDPQNDAEHRIVDWLGGWDSFTLEPLADMAERAVSAARADGYERGWAERGEQ